MAALSSVAACHEGRAPAVPRAPGPRARAVVEAPRVVLHPVAARPIAELPTHFERRGEFVASCTTKVCAVWDRRGRPVGELPEASLGDWIRDGGVPIGGCASFGLRAIPTSGDVAARCVLKVDEREVDVGDPCATGAPPPACTPGGGPKGFCAAAAPLACSSRKGLAVFGFEQALVALDTGTGRVRAKADAGWLHVSSALFRGDELRLAGSGGYSSIYRFAWSLDARAPTDLSEETLYGYEMKIDPVTGEFFHAARSYDRDGDHELGAVWEKSHGLEFVPRDDSASLDAFGRRGSEPDPRREKLATFLQVGETSSVLRIDELDLRTGRTRERELPSVCGEPSVAYLRDGAILAWGDRACAHQKLVSVWAWRGSESRVVASAFGPHAVYVEDGGEAFVVAHEDGASLFTGESVAARVRLRRIAAAAFHETRALVALAGREAVVVVGYDGKELARLGVANASKLAWIDEHTVEASFGARRPPRRLVVPASLVDASRALEDPRRAYTFEHDGCEFSSDGDGRVVRRCGEGPEESIALGQTMWPPASTPGDGDDAWARAFEAGAYVRLGDDVLASPRVPSVDILSWQHPDLEKTFLSGAPLPPRPPGRVVPPPDARLTWKGDAWSLEARGRGAITPEGATPAVRWLHEDELVRAGTLPFISEGPRLRVCNEDASFCWRLAPDDHELYESQRTHRAVKSPEEEASP